MPTATMLQPLIASWPGFALLLVVLVLLKFLVRILSKDPLREMRVLSALRGLDPGTYRYFHDLDLPHPTERGTTRIEHAVVSPFGIFIIGTNKRRGIISGSELEREWVQHVHHHRSRFQNPLLENRVKVDALMKFLKLPDPPFRPMVVFIRDCKLRTQAPGIIPCDALIPWIRRHTVTMLDPSMVSRAVSRLDELQDSLHRKATDKPQLHALHVRQAV